MFPQKFYIMPNLYKCSLCSQDMIHLLTKLRTCLLTPSNLLSIGSETTCRGHLTEFPKAQHGLTHWAIELNAHMLLNLVNNVVFGFFPHEVLKVWCSVSQACEQLFCLLCSMTPTFSNIVNFTTKGTLNRNCSNRSLLALFLSYFSSKR